jgi:uncharacterized protein (DUF1501 family)
MVPENADRRSFLCRGSAMLSYAALQSLQRTSGSGLMADEAPTRESVPHFAPTAQRVIYLFMSGGPSHVDLFDPKPELAKRNGEAIPESFVKDVHFAMIPEATKRPKLQASPFRFKKYGQSGLPVSELLPNIAGIADKLAVVNSLHSPIFNHDPAVNLLNTGDSRVGRPTMGAWLSYGLGDLTEDLPTYLVLTSGVKRQPLLTSYWSSGFLPTQHQGVELHSGEDPILFLSNPDSISRADRRTQLNLLKTLNEQRFRETNDTEILTRIKQYELAFRMQTEAPELMDIGTESQKTLDQYGVDTAKPSFARNCLLARRMVQKGVRFVQLYDMGWDSHDELDAQHRRQCRAIDQPIAALLNDLEACGMLQETLVIWGGEFGRTPVIQGGGEKWGRDHHPHGFTVWMAGGGIKPGIRHGATDEFGFHAVEDKVDVHDLHATILHLLGIDHRQFTYRHQGRDFRLTDVAGNVVRELLA